ncbi:MAG: SMP-30/gluconolactonase/LRE family protein [Acidimicrobiales bacterium]
MVEISRVGDFSLGWGESLVWDDTRQRLVFADCAAQTIHWLEAGADALHTYQAPSMPAGLVPTAEGTLLAMLGDGVHEVDLDAGTATLVTGYPAGLGDRANDACADLDGNLVTGTLNLAPAEGSAWWYSSTNGWRLLDDDIANTNGPGAVVLDGEMTLVIGDTSAHYYAYPYDGGTGTVGDRRVFGDTALVAGRPDGTTIDADGGLWCAMVGGAQLARFTTEGLDRVVDLPVANPTDVTFGGADLDRLYVVSIGAGADGDSLEGALLVVDGLGHRGRLEPRFASR